MSVNQLKVHPLSKFRFQMIVNLHHYIKYGGCVGTDPTKLEPVAGETNSTETGASRSAGRELGGANSANSNIANSTANSNNGGGGGRKLLEAARRVQAAALGAAAGSRALLADDDKDEDGKASFSGKTTQSTLDELTNKWKGYDVKVGMGRGDFIEDTGFVPDRLIKGRNRVMAGILVGRWCRLNTSG